MKKFFVLLLSFSFLIVTATTSFAKSNSDSKVLTNNGLKEKVNSSWFEEGKEASKEVATYNLFSKNKLFNAPNQMETNVVIHNNGKPLDTNVLKEKNGYELYAVYVKDDKEIEYYLSNSGSYGEEKLYNDIIEDKKSNGIATRAVTGTGSYIRNYNWNFYFNGNVHAKFSQSASFNRKSSSTSVNGVSGSVWDISMNDQLEVLTYGEGIRNQYTRMDLGFTNETLVSWGPQSNSGGQVTVSLSGLVPNISYSFNPSGYSTSDLSSKSSKYGRWAFKSIILTSKSLVTKPAVRATNTSGQMAMNLSSTCDISGSNHQTGVVSVLVPDR